MLKDNGIYPMLEHDMAKFLVSDFDKEHWKNEVILIANLCDELNIPYALERSRSGNGAHLWFFFDEVGLNIIHKKGYCRNYVSIDHEILWSDAIHIIAEANELGGCEEWEEDQVYDNLREIYETIILYLT